MTEERDPPAARRRRTGTTDWDPATTDWSTEPLVEETPPKPSRDRSWLRAGVAGGIIGALLASAIVVPLVRSSRSTTVVERRLEPGVPSTRQGGASIVNIAARARPWVVNVNVVEQQASVFGEQLQGTGSGVIMTDNGYIITNAHVVEGANTIEVTLASGEKVPAKVVGSDKETDIAVIKVDRTKLPAAVMGSVEDLRVGETAVAIGSPLGLEQTVTAGIISALNRTVDRNDTGEPPLVEMIQTDAPVTQGNSGGALVNGDGAVIGINSLIAASPEVGAEGIAFAIPIDVAVAVAQELIKSGRATHPWIGISGANITPETAKQFGVEQGALVIEVVPGGPAAKAGLRANDIIVSFDDERIDSMDELIVAIRHHKVGDRVTLGIVRGGKRTTIAATLQDKPNAT